MNYNGKMYYIQENEIITREQKIFLSKMLLMNNLDILFLTSCANVLLLVIEYFLRRIFLYFFCDLKSLIII